MCHVALKLLYTAEVIDVKCLFNRTDIQVNKPIKLLRRKLELLIQLRKATENALAESFSKHPCFPSSDTGTVSDSALIAAWKSFKSEGISTGDKSFCISMRVLEITSHLFLFIDASHHGLIEIPLLLENEWAGLYECVKKINYAQAAVCSRISVYTRSARANERTRRSRVVNLTGGFGKCDFFGEIQEQGVGQLKCIGRSSRDLNSLCAAAGFSAHLARVRRWGYRITGHKVPSSTHMPSSRAREMLCLSEAMKHLKFGEADERRTSVSSPLAPFVRSKFLPIHGSSVSRILDLQCLSSGGPEGFPVVKSQDLAQLATNGTEICGMGSMLVGFSIGLPRLTSGHRMNVCFAGKWSTSATDTVSLSSLLGETITVTVDSTTDSCGLRVQSDGLVTDVSDKSQGEAMGLVAGLARIISIGGNTIQPDGSSSFSELTQPKGSEGRRFRTYKIELKPKDLSSMTLFFYQKDSPPWHRQGHMNGGDRAGSQSRTRTKQQDQKRMRNQCSSTNLLDDAESTRIQLDKQIDETIYHKIHGESEYHTTPVKIGQIRVSNQDKEPPHPMVVDTHCTIFQAAQKKVRSAVTRYLKAIGNSSSRSSLLAGLLRGDIKPTVVSFADEVKAERVRNIDKQVRLATTQMNELKKQQLQAVDQFVLLINVPEARKSVNLPKIAQLQKLIVDHEGQRLRAERHIVHLSGIRACLIAGGIAELSQVVDSMSDSIDVTTSYMRKSTNDSRSTRVLSNDNQPPEQFDNRSDDICHDSDSQSGESSSESDMEGSDDDENGAFWESINEIPGDPSRSYLEI